MKIVVTRKLPYPTIESLARFYTIREVEKNRPLTPSELASELSRCDAAIVTVTDRIDKIVLNKATRLRAVFSFSVGVDHLDIKALRKRGIRVTYTPDVLTAATADLTLALILGCCRRLRGACEHLVRGKFRGFGPSDFLGLELNSATCGIVGLGRIGQAVAKRVAAFGATVIYTGPRKQVSYEWCEKKALLKRADIVSLHCPLTPQTHHWLGPKELKWMKRGAILVNTARGPIIDERALALHLRHTPEFTVGLDVYEKEPRIEPSLMRLVNALCVPHIGSATYQARTRMAEICVLEAIRFATGDALRYEYPS